MGESNKKTGWRISGGVRGERVGSLGRVVE